MFEKLDKNKKIIIVITTAIIMFAILFLSVIISISGSKKDKSKIDEVYLKASVIDENTLNFEIDAPKDKMINYTLEKSNTLDFKEKEEVKGSTNTEKVQIETKDIENTTYYRVKTENIETKEIIYSNVISISPKEVEESSLNNEKNSDSSMNNNELEIEERKDEKSISKSKNKEENEEKSEKEQQEEKSISSSNSEKINYNEESKKIEDIITNTKNNEDEDEEEQEIEVNKESSYKSSKSIKKSSSVKSQSSKSSKSSSIKKSNSNTKSTNKSTSTDIEIKNEEKIIEVKSIKLNAANIELDISGKKTKVLEAVINPDNTTDKRIIWSSEDEKIAKVDENGMITGIANGQTNIIAKIGKKQAKCKVKVITTATGIKLDKTKIKLDITTNKQEQIIAEAEPKTATNYNITWTSEDRKIARVDSSGKVTGTSNGKTKIIAKIGNLKKECEVVVETSPQSVLLNKKNIELDANQNNQEKIKAKITPSNSSYTKVKWKSSNTKVATVDRTGKITAIGDGIANITAQIEGKEKIKNTVKVIVKSSISNIEMSRNNIDLNLLTNYKSKIEAKIKNGEKYEKVTWNSSNESIAKVEGDGLKAIIIGLSEGEATITVNIDGKTAICLVEVKKGKLELTKSNINTLEVDGNNKTNIIISNQKNVKNIKYTSLDDNIVIVDNNGTVTGKKAGKTKIKVETDLGIGECEVKVWYKSGLRGEKFEERHYYIYVPEEKYIDIENGTSMLVYFHGAQSRFTGDPDDFGGLPSILKRIDTTYNSRKPDFKSIIVMVYNPYSSPNASQLDSLIGNIKSKYNINNKRINICGYSMGAKVSWELVASAKKTQFKNLQFASITSIGTPIYSDYSYLKDSIKKIKNNGVNMIPIYFVTTTTDMDTWSTLKRIVALSPVSKIKSDELALFDAKNNNVPFSTRVKILYGTTHGNEKLKAFTEVNNSYNLIKWIQEQERTEMY